VGRRRLWIGGASSPTIAPNPQPRSYPSPPPPVIMAPDAGDRRPGRRHRPSPVPGGPRDGAGHLVGGPGGLLRRPTGDLARYSCRSPVVLRRSAGPGHLHRVVVLPGVFQLFPVQALQLRRDVRRLRPEPDGTIADRPDRATV